MTSFGFNFQSYRCKECCLMHLAQTYEITCKLLETVQKLQNNGGEATIYNRK